MFKVGDMAVYPAQGVGVIEAIENREVMGNKQLFYIMKIMGNGMKIMIPMNGADAVGLREVIAREEIPLISRHGISVTGNTLKKSRQGRFLKSPVFCVICLF
jgi:RNA polymerase-interacting CarD/CdnL/TRCF family regulator